MFGITQTVFDIWLINCLLAYSAYVVLNGGAFSFAYVAFIAIGAYSSAIGTVEHGLDPVVAVLCGIAVSVALAFLLVAVLSRLSGIYLAMATVSVVGLMQVLLVNLDDLTGGAAGIIGLPEVTTTTLVIAVAVIALVLRQVQRSDAGLALRLTRVDPLVAGAMGVNVTRVRIWTFVASAVIGALAGALRADYFTLVTPSDYGFELVITLLAMVIVGGVGSWIGPLLGAAIFTLLPQWFSFFGSWNNLIVGAILVVIVIVSREGVVGTLQLYWRRHRHLLWSGRGGPRGRAAVGGPPVKADDS